MADNKGTHSPEEPTRQLTTFPEVKGKTIERVEISAAVDFYAITIHLHDNTALCFNVEPCVAVFPTYADWTTGDGETLKKWAPVPSIVPKI